MTKKVTKKKELTRNQSYKNNKESLLSKYSFLISLTAVIILGIVLYFHTFHVPFYYDDYDSIVGDPLIKDINNFIQFPNFLDAIHSRFISGFTLALNFHFGVLDLLGYHLVNLLIHLINSALVMLLINLTLKTPRLKNKYSSNEQILFILICGIIFVAHPLQTQAVTYIIQRMTALATMFFVSSIIFYVKARLAMKNSEYSISKKIITILFFCMSIIAFIWGLWSKQIAASLPVILVIYEFLFLREEEKINWKKVALVIIPLILIIGAAIITIGLPSETEEISRKDYFLTELNVIVTYLRLSVLPTSLNLDYDYPIYTSLFNVPTIISLIIILALFFLSIKTFKKNPLLSFSVLWFFITLSIESSFIPIRDVIVEHRVYLPLIGFSIFFASIILLIPHKYNILKYGTLTFFIVFYSVSTFERNILWNDPVAMWTDAIQKSPNKVRPIFFRGFVYLHNGEVDKAIYDFNHVISLDKNYYRAYDNLGVAYQEKKDYKTALIFLNEAIRLRPNSPYSYNNRASAYILLGRYDDALNDLNKAISITANYTDAYYNLGYVYFILKKYEDAIKYFSIAFEFNPTYTDIYNYLSYSYNELGEYKKAKEQVDLMRSKGITPNPRLLERLKF